MADVKGVTVTAIRPEAAIADLQANVACWTRAWTQMAQGLMAAELAQFELVRAIYGHLTSDPTQGVSAGSPQAVTRQCLHVSRGQFETALHGYRSIGDSLAQSFFEAANTMIESFSGEAVPGMAHAAQAAAAPQSGGQSSAPRA